MQMFLNNFTKICSVFFLFLLSPEVLRKLTLVTSVSINVLGYRLLKNQDLISMRCQIKSCSNEQILLTRRIWL